ncbi:zinc transporter ZIP4-like, partial [Convolutriloba macropyga]|uniref:zinc transporter ZIP4-like n=1 Tax=Convolutriloba macropyga TaxID=536237 RepID=UPI003F527830
MHMRKCAESQFSLLFLLAFIWKKATLNESSKIYSSSSKIVLPKAMSFFKQVLSAVLLQLVILQQVGSQNQFETHYKTLIGNLEGETLQHIYDHVTIKELRENAESFSETCLTESNLEAAYVIGNSSNVTSSELVTMCPAILYRALTAEECNPSEDEDEDKTTGYGYTWGFLSIFLISLAPILGLPLLMFEREKTWFHAILQFLIGLGVSTMACDSLLHLWPESVGLHGEGEDGSNDRTYLWRTVGMVGTLYVFFLFEALCHQIFRVIKGDDSDTHSHGHSYNLSNADASVPPSKEGVAENGFAIDNKE